MSEGKAMMDNLEEATGLSQNDGETRAEFLKRVAIKIRGFSDEEWDGSLSDEAQTWFNRQAAPHINSGKAAIDPLTGKVAEGGTTSKKSDAKAKTAPTKSEAQAKKPSKPTKTKAKATPPPKKPAAPEKTTSKATSPKNKKPVNGSANGVTSEAKPAPSKSNGKDVSKSPVQRVRELVVANPDLTVGELSSTLEKEHYTCSVNTIQTTRAATVAVLKLVG